MDIMKMGKNPNFLGSWDLEELPGKELVLVIKEIKDEVVVVNGKEENCTVCHWTDANYKPMIFNLVNKKALCKTYKTKETEKLKGKAVKIKIEKVKAFGDTHDALRIQKEIPKAPTGAAPKCENCKKDITAFGGMNPEQLAAYTKKQYGKALCSECATAAKGAQQA